MGRRGCVQGYPGVIAVGLKARKRNGRNCRRAHGKEETTWRGKVSGGGGGTVGERCGGENEIGPEVTRGAEFSFSTQF